MRPDSQRNFSTFNTDDPVQKLGYAFLIAYLFIVYSRVLDITIPYFKIPLIMTVILYAATALTGGVQRGLKTAVGKLLVVLTMLMALSVPFGMWPGGSVGILIDGWLRVFPFFFVIIAFINTRDRCIGAIRVMAAAFSIMTIIGLMRGDTDEGRLVVANSKYADPNDLALACVMALPLCCIAFITAKTKFGKMLVLLAPIPIGLALLKTGSRGGILALGVMVLYTFWKASTLQKLTVSVAAGLIIIAAVVALPGEIIARYVMLLSESEEHNTTRLQAARGSSEARLELLKDSIVVTIRNPMFGVGLGNFPVAENEMAIAEGRPRGQWHVTHNMYTQVSSEAGIPAFLCFVVIIIMSLRALKSAQKVFGRGSPHEIARAAFWLRVGMIGYSAGGFFLSVAYTGDLPVFAALAFAVLNIARVEKARSEGVPVKKNTVPWKEPSFTPAATR